MGGFGDLFGALGDLFGGVTAGAGEKGFEAAASVAGALNGDDDDDEAGADATYERYLAGGPRPLNVNDL